MNCNQDFKAASFIAKQVVKTNKYLIPSIANLRTDSFYEERYTIMPRQKPLKDDTRRHRALFFLGDKTVNSHRPFDHTDNDNINSNTSTRH